MRRKKTRPETEFEAPVPDTAPVDREAASETTTPAGKCIICGAEAAPTSDEQLCWVCRRLKISAWRDTDPQMAAQE